MHDLYKLKSKDPALASSVLNDFSIQLNQTQSKSFQPIDGSNPRPISNYVKVSIQGVIFHEARQSTTSSHYNATNTRIAWFLVLTDAQLILMDRFVLKSTVIDRMMDGVTVKLKCIRIYC